MNFNDYDASIEIVEKIRQSVHFLGSLFELTGKINITTLK